ncbi:MAG: hypothetical protein HC769_34225 [Cyanobacteria bacterium CRU_2_1]|nr:hypothetical protein [Cyanobacteria bacterium CRU_2_1]
MDIQSALNWLVQAIVMGFVSLLVFQLIAGLFVTYGRANALAPVATPHTGAMPAATSRTNAPAIAQSEFTSPVQRQIQLASLTVPVTTQQFEPVPDPWLTKDFQATQPQHQPVVLQFPALRLLPPAAEVQPKSPKTKTTKKSTSKPTKTTKQAKSALTESPRKSRNSAA